HKMFGENAERDARTENSGLSRPPPNTRYCRRLKLCVSLETNIAKRRKLTHVLPPTSTYRFAHLCRAPPGGSIHEDRQSGSFNARDGICLRATAVIGRKANLKAGGRLGARLEDER